MQGEKTLVFSLAAASPLRLQPTGFRPALASSLTGVREKLSSFEPWVRVDFTAAATVFWSLCFLLLGSSEGVFLFFLLATAQPLLSKCGWVGLGVFQSPFLCDKGGVCSGRWCFLGLLLRSWYECCSLFLRLDVPHLRLGVGVCFGGAADRRRGFSGR